MRKKFFIASIAISAITLFIACAGGKTEEAEEKDFNTLISEGDFAGAHAILQEEINNSYNLNDEISGSDRAKKIYSMADVLYKDWILDIVYSNTENPEIAISQLLAEYPIFGEKKAAGLQNYYYHKNPFVSGTSHYNQLCDKIFTAALMAKKYDIAETVINAYMEDIDVKEGPHYAPRGTTIVVDGVNVDGDHCYVKYSTKSQTEARKKLDEARKNSEQQ